MHTQLNTEFQKRARRDKKAFLNEEFKEIEENSRIGKTRGLFKKIRDTKGNFHAKMSTVKDRNCMNLIEAEDTKERWQENTEELQLCATPWTVAYQGPLSMGFSRQVYWSGLPFPSPGDLPNPGIEPGSATL